jgi:hypothetical protein
MEGIQYILNEWSEQTKEELIDKYKSMGLKASGAFEEGLTTETDENSTKIWAVPHTWYMVNGRNRNSSQDKEKIKKWVGWAGSTFLKKWVEDKGLDISPFAVAYKIAREGIRVPNQYNDGTLISSVINDNSIDGLLSKMGIYIIKDIKTEIQKTWQR